MSDAKSVAQLAPICFDVSLQETLSALTAGMTLHIPEEDIRRDPRQMVRWLAQEKINIVFLPTGLIEVLCDGVNDTDIKLPALQTVFQAGESLSLTPKLRSFFAAPGRRLHNHYGPSETHVATACDLPLDPSSWPENTSPIGRPISNTRIYLLDEWLEPVPRGAVGEIYIGGIPVARGYWRRPGLTAQRFIASPFVKGDRLYKTGDLGRYHADGNIEFLGRNDFQIKIRGFRIELGEIEARLMQHAQVREAVVIAREDETTGSRLVAYYTSKEQGGEADIQSLRTHLSLSLPEYMVPAAYIRLDAFPLTPNGKLDRGALPMPDDRAYGQLQYEAPVGLTETAVARIWAEVLQLNRIGRNDNFFNLGGHSLLAVRVVSRIRAELNTELALSELFFHPTLAALALRIKQDGQMLPTPI